MKRIILFVLLFSSFNHVHAQSRHSQFVTSDIDHFWRAYDKIKSTTDATEQLKYLNDLYIDKGSEGLKLIMEARRYSDKEYLDAINNYPLFWASIRANTYKAKEFAKEIEQGALQLKKIYPKLEDNNIYFTIGALRTPGTGKNGQILVGSELAMADENTDTSEFTTSFKHLKPYFATNPIKHIVFLNVHEYVHTQQKTEMAYDLLSQSLFEGVAEFIPTLALGLNSPTPAIAYGYKNREQVRAAFENDMFSPWHYNWIWNDLENQFKTRDLGYYIGYALAEKYYKDAIDKQKAIADLIELDFNNRDEIETFVDRIGYFSKPIKQLKQDYKNSRPRVVGIKQFKNKSQSVSAGISQITVEFSTALDTRYSATDLGPLGRAYFPEVISRAISADGLSMTYDVKLKANQVYQLKIESGFRTQSAIPLLPYLIEFKTSEESIVIAR
nr:hypothetical protein [uncultured Undibacterium sp.]